MVLVHIFHTQLAFHMQCNVIGCDLLLLFLWFIHFPTHLAFFSLIFPWFICLFIIFMIHSFSDYFFCTSPLILTCGVFFFFFKHYFFILKSDYFHDSFIFLVIFVKLGWKSLKRGKQRLHNREISHVFFSSAIWLWSGIKAERNPFYLLLDQSDWLKLRL